MSGTGASKGGATKTIGGGRGSGSSAIAPTASAKNGKDSTTAAAPARRTTPGMGRFLMGMIIYLIGAQIATYGLAFLNTHFNWQLDKKVFFTLPVLGAMTGIQVIFIVILVGLLWALYKFKVLPSNADLKAQAQIKAQERTATQSQARTGKGGAQATPTPPPSPLAGIMNLFKRQQPAVASTTGAKAKRASAQTAGDDDDLYQQVQAQRRSQTRRRRR